MPTFLKHENQNDVPSTALWLTNLVVQSSRGGMDSMLNTIWLIMAALAFGAVLERAGMLERIVAPTVAFARSTAALVATVVATAIGMNVVAGDQYLAVVLPVRMFKLEFAHRGLPPGCCRARSAIRASSRRRWYPGTAAAPTWRRRWASLRSPICRTPSSTC
jgi:hypothetical protein